MESYDLTVLGSGPGGYVAAIRAAQLGMKVAIVEREALGGVCLNWGCIPTKSLLKLAEHHEFLKSAADYGFELGTVEVQWPRVIERSRDAAEKLSSGVAHLMKKNKIQVLHGNGRYVTANRLSVTREGQRQEISTKHSIIATGARPSTIPGVEFDGARVISSKEAMIQEALPRSLTIIGAGAIGLEFAYFYQAFGTEITVIEYLDKILPTGDDDICTALARSFKKKKLKIHTSARVQRVETDESSTTTTFEKGGKEHSVSSDVTLVAVGVRGNTENIGLEDIGVEVERGFVRAGDFSSTSVGSVYAIGDVRGPPALAHVASAEGVNVVEHIAGLNPAPIDYSCIPACIYCQPQVASVGLTEQEALDAGHEVQIGRFPFAANGKSVAIGETDGFVKIIGDARFGEILGAHVIGSEATELIGELAMAKAAELTVHDIHHTIHSHPTLSESIMEAAADWAGAAIQI